MSTEAWGILYNGKQGYTADGQFFQKIRDIFLKNPSWVKDEASRWKFTSAADIADATLQQAMENDGGVEEHKTVAKKWDVNAMKKTSKGCNHMVQIQDG
jgi:hypothetical protein